MVKRTIGIRLVRALWAIADQVQQLGGKAFHESG